MAKRIDPVKRILTLLKKLSDEQVFELWKAIVEDPGNRLYPASAAQISVQQRSSNLLSLEQHRQMARQMAKRNRQKDKQRLIDGQRFSEMKHKQKLTWPDILKVVIKDEVLRKRHLEGIGKPASARAE